MDIHEIYSIFLKYYRKKRMIKFEKLFKLDEKINILDVGGDQFNWQFINSNPLITILNLSKPKNWDISFYKKTKFEMGNGTQLKYQDKSFDVVYSNSVIEHLSTWKNQQKFAKEALRVGRGIFIQTPAKYFFAEPHLLTPFIHFLPKKMQSRLLKNFTIWGLITRPEQSYIDSFINETRLLTYKEFAELFCECKIIKEKFFIFSKSYIAIKEID